MRDMPHFQERRIPANKLATLPKNHSKTTFTAEEITPNKLHSNKMESQYMPSEGIINNYSTWPIACLGAAFQQG